MRGQRAKLPISTALRENEKHKLWGYYVKGLLIWELPSVQEGTQARMARNSQGTDPRPQHYAHAAF